jgi:hypothetical protein
MSSRRLTLAAAAWLATAAFAAAQPATTVDTPIGDVWVTQEAPRPLPSQTAQNAPLHRLLPTGDFWPPDDGATRTANAPVPVKDASARE